MIEKNIERRFNLAAKLNESKEGVIKAISPEVADSAKAVGLVKRRKKMSKLEAKWLLDVFLKDVSTFLFLNSRKMASGGKHHYSALKQMSEEDILGEVCGFFFGNKRLLANFDNSKASFVQYFRIAAFRHLRDLSRHYDLGGKSVSRTRRAIL